MKKMMSVIHWIIFVTLVTSHLHQSEAFQSCPSVCTCKWKNGKRWVECQKKQQISIPDNIDPETQVLDLGGNNLQILPREVFSRHGLLNLQKLKLSNCKIGQIDPTAFRGLTNLVELDLSSNLLTSVPTPTFSDIPYLRELALNNNPLQKIEGHAFEMVPQLVALDVSGCQIKKISARAFHNIKQLERLYLHNNKIEEIKQRTVDRMGGLHSLTLHGNPWQCDCHLRTLIDWLVVANLPMVDLPRCKAPKRLEGQRFADIALDNFACSPELLTSPRYIEANVGSNASLVCRVGSVPGADIIWLRDGIEILNNSLIENSSNRRMQRRYIMENSQLHSDQTISKLILTQAQDVDGGQYKCIAENKAGRVETNYTLNVGYFSGPGSLNAGEIVGITITVILLVMIIIVVMAVLTLKIRPRSLLSGKHGRVDLNNVNSSHPNGHAAHMEMNFTSVQGVGGQNGSVVINGTTYTAASQNGVSSNGYVNPDVIPTNSAPHMTVPDNSMVETMESVQNRLNSNNASEMLQNCSETEIISPTIPALHQKNRYENLPQPVSSVGVAASFGDAPPYTRNSFSYSPHIFVRNNSENNRLYGSGTLRENLSHGYRQGQGSVNDSFSDDTLGLATPPTFRRDLRLYSDHPGYRGSGVMPPDSLYDNRQSSLYSHSQSSYNTSSPFFHGTLPKNVNQRSDWVAAPIRLPDWSVPSHHDSMWTNQQPYPPDYGLPLQRGQISRPEIHLAHNPLDTLEEEDIFPDQTFSNGSIHPVEMLSSTRDNSESSGRGSSSSGSAKDRSWNIPTSSPSSLNSSSTSVPVINGGSMLKKPFQTASARESPDEGIQTDSGTDV